jgi:hypothetical protein
MSMKKTVFFLLPALFLLYPAFGEEVRVNIAGRAEVTQDKPAAVINLGYTDSGLVSITGDTRFMRGIELELVAPGVWPQHQGSLALAVYTLSDKPPQTGIADITGRRVYYEILPGKIQNVYQIALRERHSLRTTPYVTLVGEVIPPAAFPILVRIQPVMKGIGEEIENAVFQLNVKPVLSDEGLVKITPHYPPSLPVLPVTALIDDRLVENIGEEQLLREGEHQLVLLSQDYRNENRRFIVERGKTHELSINLQDLIPLIIFEAPAEADVFLDNAKIDDTSAPLPVEAGQHEVKIQVSDYALIKPLLVERGKTYRVTFTADLHVAEE